MGRLKRFEAHRFVGVRDTMTVYDCDDAGQLKDLERRVEAGRLGARDLVQAFAPDTLAEASNRGFRPPR